MKIIQTLVFLLVSTAAASAGPGIVFQADRPSPRVSVKADPQKGQSFLGRLFGRNRKAKAPATVAEAKAPSAPSRPKAVASRTQPKRSSVARVAPKAKAPATTVAKAPAKVRGAQPPAKPATEVRLAVTRATNVLEAAPKVSPKSPAWQPKYSTATAVGRAWERAWDEAVREGTGPTTVEVERKVARVTAFHRSDANSANRKSATGVPLRAATGSQIGVASGPPEMVGSYVTLSLGGEDRVYLVADTGSDLVTKKADTEGVGTVVDLYAPSGQKWPDYQRVQVVAVSGAAHYLLTPPSERHKFLEWATYQRACVLALYGPAS